MGIWGTLVLHNLFDGYTLLLILQCDGAIQGVNMADSYWYQSWSTTFFRMGTMDGTPTKGCAEGLNEPLHCYAVVVTNNPTEIAVSLK